MEIRIYLADDDTDDRQFFLDALSDIPQDTNITVFENGVDLMADLFSDAPSPRIIFLDLYMPLMTGFECLADIRNIPEFADIKVVIYSTFLSELEIDKLKEAGADGYLQKPHSFNQLKTVLHKCIEPLSKDRALNDSTATFQVFV